MLHLNISTRLESTDLNTHQENNFVETFVSNVKKMFLGIKNYMRPKIASPVPILAT